jgi:hypothetical protein
VADFGISGDTDERSNSATKCQLQRVSDNQVTDFQAGRWNSYLGEVGGSVFSAKSRIGLGPV